MTTPTVATATVGNMTQAELIKLVEEMVARKLSEVLEQPVHPKLLAALKSPHVYTWHEALDALDRVRWTPPAGAPTPLEILREMRGE